MGSAPIATPGKSKSDTETMPAAELEDPTITEAAHICGVHRNTVLRYLDLGRFPGAYRETGPRGPWRIPHQDLAAAGLEPGRNPAWGRREKARCEMHEQVEILRVRGQEVSWRAELAEGLSEEREKRIRDLRGALGLLGRREPE